MREKRDQRTLIIVSLLVIVSIMVAGFAAFATNLTINGTSNISTSWNIQITNIRGVNDKSVTNNQAYEVTDPTITNNNLNANFHTGLISPGDTRIYEVEVSNLGSVDAEITKTLTANTTSDAIEISYLGVAPVGTANTSILANDGTFTPTGLITSEPFNLPATTNNVRYIYIKVKYKDNVTSQPSSLSASITLELDAVQSTGSHEETSTPSTFTGVIYRWSTAPLANKDSSTSFSKTIANLTKDTDYITENDYQTYSSRTIFFGKQYYLKHTIVNDEITESYVCFVNNNGEHCMKGGDNGASFATNTQTIKDYQTFYNLGSYSNGTGCYFASSMSYCRGGGFYYVYAYSGGDVRVDSSSSSRCRVSSDGTSYCDE